MELLKVSGTHKSVDWGLQVPHVSFVLFFLP